MIREKVITPPWRQRPVPPVLGVLSSVAGRPPVAWRMCYIFIPPVCEVSFPVPMDSEAVTTIPPEKRRVAAPERAGDLGPLAKE